MSEPILNLPSLDNCEFALYQVGDIKFIGTLPESILFGTGITFGTKCLLGLKNCVYPCKLCVPKEINDCIIINDNLNPPSIPVHSNCAISLVEPNDEDDADDDKFVTFDVDSITDDYTFVEYD